MKPSQVLLEKSLLDPDRWELAEIICFITFRSLDAVTCHQREILTRISNPRISKKKLFFFTNTLLATFSSDMEDDFINALLERNSMKMDDGSNLALDTFSVYRICRQCFRFRQFRLAARIAQGKFNKKSFEFIYA